jgi:hypothetical protein
MGKPIRESEAIIDPDKEKCINTAAYDNRDSVFFVKCQDFRHLLLLGGQPLSKCICPALVCMRRGGNSEVMGGACFGRRLRGAEFSMVFARLWPNAPIDQPRLNGWSLGVAAILGVPVTGNRGATPVDRLRSGRTHA